MNYFATILNGSAVVVNLELMEVAPMQTQECAGELVKQLEREEFPWTDLTTWKLVTEESVYVEANDLLCPKCKRTFNASN